MKIGSKTIQVIVRAKHSLRKMVVQSCVPTSYAKWNFVIGECKVKLRGTNISMKLQNVDRNYSTLVTTIQYYYT